MGIEPTVSDLIHSFLYLHFPSQQPPELTSLNARVMYEQNFIQAWRSAVIGDWQIDVALMVRDILVLDFVFQKGVEYRLRISLGNPYIKKCNDLSHGPDLHYEELFLSYTKVLDAGSQEHMSVFTRCLLIRAVFSAMNSPCCCGVSGLDYCVNRFLEKGDTRVWDLIVGDAMQLFEKLGDSKERLRMLEDKIEALFLTGIRVHKIDVLLESITLETWKALGVQALSRASSLLTFLLKVFVSATGREEQVRWMVEYPIKAECVPLNAWLMNYAYHHSFLGEFLGALACLTKSNPEVVKNTFKLVIQDDSAFSRRMQVHVMIESKLTKEVLSASLANGSMYNLITILASVITAGVGFYLVNLMWLVAEEGECADDFKEISRIVLPSPFCGTHVNKTSVNPLTVPTGASVLDCVGVWGTVVKSYPWPYFLEALSHVDFENAIAQQVAVALFFENPACREAILDVLISQKHYAGLVDTFKLASEDKADDCVKILVHVTKKGIERHDFLMRLMSSASRAVLDLYYEWLIDKEFCGLVVEEVYNSNMKMLEAYVLKSVSSVEARVTDTCVTGFFKHCRESGRVVQELFDREDVDAMGRILRRLMDTAAGARDLTWFFDCWMGSIIKVWRTCVLIVRTLLVQCRLQGV